MRLAVDTDHLAAFLWLGIAGGALAGVMESPAFALFPAVASGVIFGTRFELGAIFQVIAVWIGFVIGMFGGFWGVGLLEMVAR